jgi:hypothetical protein
MMFNKKNRGKARGGLLHIHEQVALEDVLAFFVSLGRLVGLVL